MKSDGIELYSSNAQHIASDISKHGWSLDHVAEEILHIAKEDAAPYQKSTTDSYVDHFGIDKVRYTGKQHDPQYPVFDRLVYNDDPQAHIIELGFAGATNFQQGHFFLTGAAAKVIGMATPPRPAPAPSRSGWDNPHKGARHD